MKQVNQKLNSQASAQASQYPTLPPTWEPGKSGHSFPTYTGFNPDKTTFRISADEFLGLPTRFPIRDRICRTLSIGKFYKKVRISNPRRKRNKMLYGWYRKNARAILRQLEPDDMDSHLFSSPLGYMGEWLLLKLYAPVRGRSINASYSTPEYNFLLAIAKDAGVWPAPKWWRAKKRLVQSTRHST